MLQRSLTLAIAVSFPLFAVAGDPDHAIVPGFERFHGQGQQPAEGGRLLLGELNCVSCHSADGIVKKEAPILTDVGSRVKVGFLRKFLTDPQSVKPGTTMPRMLEGDPDRAAKIEALVHFLASTGTPRAERPSLKGIVLGSDLYRKVGCMVCHGPRDAAAKAGKTTEATIPLGDLKSKYSIASLAAFLENPLHSRPSGRMPRILNFKEANDVANYLLQGLNVELLAAKGTTKFSYYEGAWDKLPDFAKLKPALTGTAGAFDLGVAPRGGDYAIKFEGVFKADRDGNYRFFLSSDDGSNLYIDGKKVVDDDGIHPTQGAGGSVRLTKGMHHVTVAFFQAGGGAELDVKVRIPGSGIQPLGELVAATEEALVKKPEPKKKKTEDDIDIQPELVDKGKIIFASAGCANCHQMNVESKLIQSTLRPTALRGEHGCLSTKLQSGLPNYSLAPPSEKHSRRRSRRPRNQAPTRAP